MTEVLIAVATAWLLAVLVVLAIARMAGMSDHPPKE